MINIRDWQTITEADFDEMQFDSGFICKNFDPSTFEIPDEDDIIDVTSGNISFTLTPTIVDLGSDVNGSHGVYKELQYLSSWSGAQLTYTSLKFSTAAFKRNLGAAVVSGTKVSPRLYLDNSDFENIAWVGKLVSGGFAAIVLKNALSTGGINITSSKDGKGTNSVTMTGFMSISDENSVPAEFYAVPGLSVELSKHRATIAVNGTLELTANTFPRNASVTWASDDSTKASVDGGTVTGVAAGTAVITATVTRTGGATATDECVVTVSAGA